MKKVLVSVINDLSTDQRVHKVCTSLTEMGFDVCLIGRQQRTSLVLNRRDYATKRMKLLFEKGPLFYLEFNFRLFLYLLFHRAEVLVSNDLDTLLPNYLIAKLKGAELVYDSHEVFCEVPELQENPVKRKIWKRLEAWIFPKLKHVFTVNASIAELYRNEYGNTVHIVRNIPVLLLTRPEPISLAKFGVPSGKAVILLQGAGINVDRGAEEAVTAMKYIDNACLLIVGSGDVIPLLKKMVQEMNLGDKVVFTGKVPFEQLRQITAMATIGLTLDKATNVNYRLSLPNKVFDYIHAGVPVLCSDLVEVKKIVLDYSVGMVAANHDPQSIADSIKTMLRDESQLLVWKKNTIIAAEKLNWSVEENELKSVYGNFLDR